MKHRKWRTINSNTRMGLPRDLVRSLPLEILKTQRLDIALSNLSWLTLSEQEDGLDNLQNRLPTSNSLCFPEMHKKHSGWVFFSIIFNISDQLISKGCL